MDQVVTSRIDIHILLDSLAFGLVHVTRERPIQQSETHSHEIIHKEFNDGPHSSSKHSQYEGRSNIIVPLKGKIRVLTIERQPKQKCLLGIRISEQ